MTSNTSSLPGEIALRPVDRHDLRLPSVFEKRLHRFTEDDLRPASRRLRRCRTSPSRGWCGIRGGADRRVGDLLVTPGPSITMRHSHRGLIEQIAVLRLTVIAEPLAMIAGDDDRGRARRLTSRTPRTSRRTAGPSPPPPRDTDCPYFVLSNGRRERTAREDRSSAPREGTAVEAGAWCEIRKRSDRSCGTLRAPPLVAQASKACATPLS